MNSSFRDIFHTHLGGKRRPYIHISTFMPFKRATDSWWMLWNLIRSLKVEIIRGWALWMSFPNLRYWFLFAISLVPSHTMNKHVFLKHRSWVHINLHTIVEKFQKLWLVIMISAKAISTLIDNLTYLVVIILFGLPEILESDAVYNSKTFMINDIIHAISINRVNSSPYEASSNGLIEREL